MPQNGTHHAYFYDIKESENKFIANVDPNGFGLLQFSGNRLKGRKLFFAAGQTIKCSRRTLGIMQTMSAAHRYKTFL